MDVTLAQDQFTWNAYVAEPTSGRAAFQKVMLTDKRLVARLMLDLSSYNGAYLSRELPHAFLDPYLCCAHLRDEVSREGRIPRHCPGNGPLGAISLCLRIIAGRYYFEVSFGCFGSDGCFGLGDFYLEICF